MYVYMVLLVCPINKLICKSHYLIVRVGRLYKHELMKESIEKLCDITQ